MAGKIRIGFIGCGQIARHHLTQYAKMVERVEVVALCDISEACVAQAAKDFAVKNTYTDFHELLAPNRQRAHEHFAAPLDFVRDERRLAG